MRSQTLKDNFDSRGDRKLLHDSGTNLCSPTTTQVVRFTDKVQRQRPALFRNNSYVREPFRTNPTCPPPPPDPQTTHNPYVTVSPLSSISQNPSTPHPSDHPHPPLSLSAPSSHSSPPSVSPSPPPLSFSIPSRSTSDYHKTGGHTQEKRTPNHPSNPQSGSPAR